MSLHRFAAAAAAAATVAAAGAFNKQTVSSRCKLPEALGIERFYYQHLNSAKCSK